MNIDGATAVIFCELVSQHHWRVVCSVYRGVLGYWPILGSKSNKGEEIRDQCQKNIYQLMMQKNK